MLERIRAKMVTVSIGGNGRMVSAGAMTAMQRKYLAAHETELLAELWREDGVAECVGCLSLFDVHREGRYTVDAVLICGRCWDKAEAAEDSWEVVER